MISILLGRNCLQLYSCSLGSEAKSKKQDFSNVGLNTFMEASRAVKQQQQQKSAHSTSGKAMVLPGFPELEDSIRWKS